MFNDLIYYIPCTKTDCNEVKLAFYPDDYNLIIEDIGTVYRQSITCDGSFLPYKYNSGVGQFFVFRGNAE